MCDNFYLFLFPLWTNSKPGLRNVRAWILVARFMPCFASLTAELFPDLFFSCMLARLLGLIGLVFYNVAFCVCFIVWSLWFGDDVWYLFLLLFWRFEVYIKLSVCIFTVYFRASFNSFALMTCLFKLLNYFRFLLLSFVFFKNRLIIFCKRIYFVEYILTFLFVSISFNNSSCIF